MIQLVALNAGIRGFTAQNCVRISRKSAAILCGEYPPPKQNETTIVATQGPIVTYDDHTSRRRVGFVDVLEVFKDETGYYLRSRVSRVTEWPQLFGVQIIEVVPIIRRANYWSVNHGKS